MTLKKDLFCVYPQDWQGSVNGSAVERRKQAWSGLSLPVRRAMTAFIPLIRSARERVIEKYLLSLEEELELAAIVELADSSTHLLTAIDLPKNDPIHVQQRYEAMQVWDMATAMGVLSIENPLQQARHDLRRLVRLFERELFAQTGGWVDIWSYHAGDKLRVERISIDSKLSRAEQGALKQRYSPLNCRATRAGLLVSFHHRVKHPFDVWLKVYRQVHQADARANPYAISDQCGLKILVANDEEATALVGEIRSVLSTVGGSVCELKSNIGKSGPMNGGNYHSSPHFKAAKYNLSVWGRDFELQVMTFANHYDSRYSLGAENHVLYRLDQIIETYGPILFASSVYRSVDWKNTEMRELLMGRAIARLGWQFSPRSLHRLTQDAMHTWLSSPP